MTQAGERPMDERKIPIQTKGLSKSFGRRMVLRQIDFDVAEGECVALTGANGAGKTTLLRCLATVIRPNSGEVRWFGRLATADLSARRLVAMVAHESLLYPHLTLRENLVFAARMYGVSEPHQRADDWLRNAALNAHAHRLPVQISKGMRQRLAVARAMIHDPRIVLFDEPFSSLDQQGAGWLLELLRELRSRGCALCFATHDEQTVQQLADRVIELRSGQLFERDACDRAALTGHDTLHRAA